jgi:hypothetical protein
MSLKKTVDQKLNVKPIFSHLIHSAPYEGPCRIGRSEQLTPEYDERVGAETFQTLKKNLKNLYSDDVNLLEPSYVTWTDDFVLRDEKLELADSDLNKTDIFLVNGHLANYYAGELAKKYKKPVGTAGCCSTDSSAYLKSIGLEGYAYIDHSDAREHFSLLRARKGITHTRVLHVLKNTVVTKGVVSSIRNIDYLTQRYGIQFSFVNSQEVLDTVTNLDREGIKEAEATADKLIKNAEFCSMERQYVINSTKFYIAVKRLLEKYECNAFTIPCFEICATRRLDKEKYTFCLAHSLLKEEGIPSACEADLSALFAIDILMNITNSAPHMGNLHPANKTNSIPNLGGGGILVAEDFKNTPEKFKKMDNLVYIFHAVPTRYMGGRDKAPSSYGIQSFTYSGWGATLRYNYDKDINKEITFLRVDPTGTKMLATKAVIVGDVGYKDNIGCSTGFYAQVNDVKDFFKKESQVGHHHAWVYGDIRDKIKELGEIMGMEVITT